MRKCESCEQIIPQVRLKAIPNTTFCVQCKHNNETEADRPLGMMTYDHKTGGTCQKVTREEYLDYQRMDRRGYKRLIPGQ